MIRSGWFLCNTLDFIVYLTQNGFLILYQQAQYMQHARF